ncbi:unnamed protein product [Tilletia controversa]|nr:hypothetical protein CF335_g6824 [Tilletia laevis]CAD6885699.1 unnamed protein product [Tilletia caries]CAD6899172.1 unnamed protein product [Tilletia controversa]CAD6929055.1 unnamed protein product [Tilletia laevis]CAD6931992.1 unnamed protein product [Tilletia controversa]
MLTICSNDSLEEFLMRLGPKVQKEIGGIPADWMIQLKSSGSDSEYFKEFTLLEIDGKLKEEEAHSQWLWRMFLQELETPKTGEIHVTLRNAPPSAPAELNASKSTKEATKKGKNKAAKQDDVVNSAGPMLVTKGQTEKDDQLARAHRCTAINCPYRHVKDRCCWHPYWAPKTHISLDFTARAVCAMAWDRGETGGDLLSPPRLPPFVPAATPASRTNNSSSRLTGSPTKDASTAKPHADTAQDDTVIALLYWTYQ